jgi:hypothetical protein
MPVNSIAHQSKSNISPGLVFGGRSIRDSDKITMTVTLREGEFVTVSIGAINENYFVYTGGPAPVTVSH